MPTVGSATYSSLELPESTTKETYSSRVPAEADHPRKEDPKKEPEKKGDA